MNNLPPRQELHHIAAEQAYLEKAGRMHWLHWLVVFLSVLLTLVVWQFSKNQLNDKVHTRFQRETDQIANLIIERLQKYEDALWSSVATVQAMGGDMDFESWQSYANALHIDEKYKGINGIGVIHAVPIEQRDAYLKRQRLQRPDYNIHPELNKPLLLPISYIVPVAENAAAVGLDVAHENNRLRAALNARDSGRAQITGPIVLVQDAAHTPGFLFYAPFYRNNTQATLAQRRENFAGLIYAPFVVHKLMQGTLEKERRQLEVSIRDDGKTIYKESAQGLNHDDAQDTTPADHLHNTYTLPVYGRDWQVDIWATPSYRQEALSSQPLLILAGGITIDLMLLLLFATLSRANRRSLAFAKRMSKAYQIRSQELQKMVRKLEARNQELAQFTYIASHDLQEPLRTLSNFSGLLQDKLKDSSDEQSRMAAKFIAQAAQRMRNLVLNLLSYNRIGARPQLEQVNCNTIVAEVCADLGSQIAESGSEVRTGQLPTTKAVAAEMRLLFQNLISNAIKFRRSDQANTISISCVDAGADWHFHICDNGLGIAKENYEQIFQIFRRLHREESIAGSGIGLASCKKVVTMHGGRIWVTSTEGAGSCFHFTLPKEPVYDQEI